VIRRSGFTLIEMVITVALVAVLASIVVPMAQMTQQRTREQELRLALREIRTAIDAFKRAGDEGHIQRSGMTTGYPESLRTLIEGVPNQQDPKGGKLYFLRRIPRDPFAGDASMPVERTWGLRSYASEPGDPRPGDDVYDIYSLSDRVGLNGIPYKEW